MKETHSLSELEQFDPKNTKHGRQRRFLCPDCGSEKPKDSAHRSLAVNTDTGLYICHRCQTKGCLREFWETRPIMPKRKQATVKLNSHFAIASAPASTKKTEKSENLAEKMAFYQSEFLHSPAEMYLLGRGINTEFATDARCGYAERWEHWEKQGEQWVLSGTDRRVVFPIYDWQGNLVAIHGRAIDDVHVGSAKLTKGDKSHGLFLSDASALRRRVVAVCEGAIDALALASAGIPAVAMTGINPPEWFYRKMGFKRVLVATDADEAGDKASINLQRELRARGAAVLRLRPKTAKDWGEVVESMTRQALNESLGVFKEDLPDRERIALIERLTANERIDAAEFAAGLISDPWTREQILFQVRYKHRQAA